MGNQYVIGGIHGVSRDAWRTHPLGSRASAAAQSHAATLLAGANAIRYRGRQLLDHEGISCLLILLFIDDPKINTTRLHRILRNLCYHPPTREWVVRSLLSILEKSNEGRLDHDVGGGAVITEVPAHHKSSKKSSSKESASSSSTGSKDKTSTSAPSWLNISLDAALGFRANVFQVIICFFKDLKFSFCVNELRLVSIRRQITQSLMEGTKFQRNGVPTQNSLTRRIPKLCNLSRVKVES